jgi:hypothetical protein
VAAQSGFTADQIVERGEEIYDRQIREHVEAENRGRYIAIDIETGAYEIGDGYHALAKHLLTGKPDAALCILRIGYEAVGRIGGRAKAA